jgi:hypothetical protein
MPNITNLGEKVKHSGSDKLSANHKQEFAVEAMFLSDQNE